MMMIKKFTRITICTYVLIWLIGCGGSSGIGLPVPTPPPTPPPAPSRIIGVLPGGDAVYVNPNVFHVSKTESVPTTGTLGITGSANYIGTVTLAVVPSFTGYSTTRTPSITTLPATCVLNSSIAEQSTCQLIVNGESATAGEYLVTAAITDNDTESTVVLNSFKIDVSESKVIESGSLAVVFHPESIEVGESSTAIVQLNGAKHATNVNVTITNNTPQIASIVSDNCTILSSADNICTIGVLGLESSTIPASISVHSPGYATASASLYVNRVPVPYLSLSLGESTIVPESITTVTAQLSYAPTSDALVTFSLPELNSVIGLNPESCVVESGTTSCSVTATAGTSEGSATINADTTIESVTRSASTVLNVAYPQMAYVVVQESGSNNSIAECPIDASGTAFGTCITMPAGLADGITVDNTNRLAYIVLSGASYSIMACPITSSGILDPDCTTTSIVLPDDLQDDFLTGAITLSESTVYFVVGSHTVADFSEVYACTRASSGALSDCTPGIPAVFTGDSLSLGGLTTYQQDAYLTDSTRSGVIHCTINADASFHHCDYVLANDLDYPQGMVLNSTGTTAYITNGHGSSTSVCTIESSYAFACNTSIGTLSGGGDTHHPSSLTLSHDNNIAYITAGNNNSNNMVAACSLESSSVCNIAESFPDNQLPVGIAVSY